MQGGWQFRYFCRIATRDRTLGRDSNPSYFTNLTSQCERHRAAVILAATLGSRSHAQITKLSRHCLSIQGRGSADLSNLVAIRIHQVDHHAGSADGALNACRGETISRGNVQRSGEGGIADAGVRSLRNRAGDGEGALVLTGGGHRALNISA